MEIHQRNAHPSFSSYYAVFVLHKPQLRFLTLTISLKVTINGIIQKIEYYSREWKLFTEDFKRT